jgi:alkanesulfonate monooxygenase SsuD/methylene tetrahydromethanopterin reductase-like flavin-dependent oxidoreductase (luciferase family)
VLVQAGASPRGIAASARFAEVVFGFGPGAAAQRRHREALDAALVAEGRDPATVGILWATQVVVGRTRDEAAARRAEALEFWSAEAVGAFLSHNAGFDFSTVPERFTVGELRDEVFAAQAAQGGFVGRLAAEYGDDHELTRDELLELGWQSATGMDHTVWGSATEVADLLEENFAETGARGGYMLSSPLGMPAGLDEIVGLLTPELRRRGALAPRYPGRTLRENLAT